MASIEARSVGRIATDIARSKRHHPDQDTSALYAELERSHVFNAARKIVARFGTRPDEEIQAVAEILRGGDAA